MKLGVADGVAQSPINPTSELRMMRSQRVEASYADWDWESWKDPCGRAQLG